MTLVAVGASCAVNLDEYLFDSGGTFFQHAGFGITIDQFDEYGQSATVLSDGTVELGGTARVRVEGRDEAQVEAVIYVEPVADGGRRTLFTTDVATQSTRAFHFDEIDNAVVIGDLDGGVFVFGNADGSYDVVTSRFDAPASEDEYERAEDGYAAWRLVQAYSEFTDASFHSVALAFAMANLSTLPSRGVTEERGPSADGPVICGLFAAYCTCTGCYLAGQTDGDCAPCAAQ